MAEELICGLTTKNTSHCNSSMSLFDQVSSNSLNVCCQNNVGNILMFRRRTNYINTKIATFRSCKIRSLPFESIFFENYPKNLKLLLRLQDEKFVVLLINVYNSIFGYILSPDFRHITWLFTH